MVPVLEVRAETAENTPDKISFTGSEPCPRCGNPVVYEGEMYSVCRQEGCILKGIPHYALDHG